jgi:hypothetical protein
MSGASMEGPLRLTVDARNDQYDPDDDRWLDQATALYQELRTTVDVVPGGQPTPGAKGAIDQLIIALGSAGAFEAAVRCFLGWLARDRDRRIDITWDEGGVERSVTLTGDAMDTKTMRTLAMVAAKQMGDQPWPAATEHSLSATRPTRPTSTTSSH